MDMLFNPSVTETFGNVTLEAMAAGLPVVAASATGSQSLVDRRRHRPPDPARRPGPVLRRARRFIAATRRRGTKAGKAGCEASQRYGWDEVNQELVDAYLRLIRAHYTGGRQRPSPVP